MLHTDPIGSLFSPVLRRSGLLQLSDHHRGLLNKSKLALSVGEEARLHPVVPGAALDQTIHRLKVRNLAPEKIAEVLERGLRIEKTHNLPYPIASLLALRGHEPGPTLARYLAPKMSVELPRSALPHGTSELADRLLRACRAQQHIVLIGDYDVDGVTSACILRFALEAAGARVTEIHPGRVTEGYGVSVLVARRASLMQPDFVVALDCGTNDFAGVDVLKSSGATVAVVDHHRNETGRTTSADVLVNPTAPNCGFANGSLVAAGHAFLLAREIIQEGQLDVDLRVPLLLAAIGTLADVGTMGPQNRALVREGLAAAKMLADDNLLPPGLRAIIHASAPDYRLDENDVWFRIAPWINAPGRLTSTRGELFGANIPAAVLAAKSHEEAIPLLTFMRTENERRQQLEAQAGFTCSRLAERFIRANRENVPAAFVLSDRYIHPGVAGPVAMRITDKFHVPTIVLAAGGTGSGRSIEGVDLYAAVAKSRSGLEGRFGGHTVAVGLTLLAQDIVSFRARFLANVAEQRKNLPPVSEVIPEFSVTLRELSLDPTSIAQQIKFLGPFGKDNPVPKFVLDDVQVKKAELNKTGQHVALTLVQDGGVVRTGHLFRSPEGHSALAQRLAGSPINALQLAPQRATSVTLCATLFTLSWRRQDSYQQELRLSVSHGWEHAAIERKMTPKINRKRTEPDFIQQLFSFNSPAPSQKLTYPELIILHSLTNLNPVGLRENAQQTELIDKILKRFKSGDRSVIFTAPQGEGKTTMAAALIDGLLRKGDRAIFLVPRKSLLPQIETELRARLSLPSDEIRSLSANATLRSRVMFCQNPPTISIFTDSLGVQLLKTGRISLEDPTLRSVVFDEGHHGGELRGPQRIWARRIGLANSARARGILSLVQSATLAQNTAGLEDLTKLHGTSNILRLSAGAGAPQRTIHSKVVGHAKWSENAQRRFREAMLDFHDQLLVKRNGLDDALRSGWASLLPAERRIFANIEKIWDRRTRFFPSQTAIAATISACVSIRERLKPSGDSKSKKGAINLAPLAALWSEVAALGSARAIANALAHEGALPMLSLVTSHLLDSAGISSDEPYNRYHWRVRLLSHYAMREGLRSIISNSPYENVLSAFEQVHLRAPTVAPATFEALWRSATLRSGAPIPTELSGLSPRDRGAALIAALAKDSERWLDERRFIHPKEIEIVKLLEASGTEPVIIYVPNKELGAYLAHRINTTHGLVKRQAGFFVGGGSDKLREQARTDFTTGKSNTLVATSAISEGVNLLRSLGVEIRSIRNLILWSPVGWVTQAEQLYGRVGRGELGIGEVTVLVGRGIEKNDSGEFGVMASARSGIRKMKSAVFSMSKEP